MAWSVGIKSIAGPNHASKKIPCQDYGAYKILKDGTLIAVISDGAGSAKYGGLGAKLTVEAALSTLEKNNTDKLIPYIHRRLKKEAKRLKADLADFACTFIALLANSDHISVFQVGDGFAVARFENEYELLLFPQKGEHINETCFITQENAEKIIQKRTIEKRPLFISLSTDGLENVALFYQNWKPYRGFFSPLDQYINKTNSQNEAAQEIESFLNSPLLRQKSDDDKTLFLCGWQE